jgi:1-acyl-sn-glycerol-3-phosphate acyltransferase
MWLGGWSASGEVPPVDKYVVIAAPHTSNWDGWWMLVLKLYYGIPLYWLGKHTLFRGPTGWFLKWMGGISVDRRSANNVVAELAQVFEERETIALGLAPEGSRARREYWKSGFYQIARAANVPIALGFLDYGRREGGFGGLLWPSDDLSHDMDIIRAFYADKSGDHPERAGPIRLRREEQTANNPEK